VAVCRFQEALPRCLDQLGRLSRVCNRWHNRGCDRMRGPALCGIRMAAGMRTAAGARTAAGTRVRRCLPAGRRTATPAVVAYTTTRRAAVSRSGNDRYAEQAHATAPKAMPPAGCRLLNLFCGQPAADAPRCRTEPALFAMPCLRASRLPTNTVSIILCKPHARRLDVAAGPAASCNTRVRPRVRCHKTLDAKVRIVCRADREFRCERNHTSILRSTDLTGRWDGERCTSSSTSGPRLVLAPQLQ